MGVSGDDYRRFGGNTTCFYSEVEPSNYLIVDAGTGLRRLQHALGGRSGRFTILLSHYHWDHIQGLPLFAPLYDKDSEVVVYGAGESGAEVSDILTGAIRPPWWPITPADAIARVTYLPFGDSIEVGPVTVDHTALNHPQGVTAFRMRADRSIVIATDHESGDPAADERLAEFASGVNVLIHDAQYTPEEHQLKKGWGHSNFASAATMARDAGVGQLVLTSHDPDRTDDGVASMRTGARAIFARTEAAYEGMTIPF